MTSMSKEQKELLYKICCLYSQHFSLQMSDIMTEGEKSADDKVCYELAVSKSKYISDYGELPEMKYINDVWDIKKKLEQEGINGI